MAAVTSAVASVGIAAKSASDARSSASKGRRRGRAAERRAQEVQEAAEAQARADLEPFREFGAGQVSAAENILTPQGQFDFLEGHPIFDAALSSVNRDTNASAASRGRFAAGDTAGELFQNYLTQAFPLLQNQTNNLFNAIGIGGNAAARTGNTAFNTGQGLAESERSIGNLNLASGVARTNANTALAETAIGALPTILGGFNFQGGVRNPDLSTVGGLVPNPPPGT